MLLCTLSLLAGVALAEDPPEEGDSHAPPPAETGPLAIPANPPGPGAQRLPPGGGPPLAQPGQGVPPSKPTDLRALRTYRQGRLVLRAETEYHQGPATAWSFGGGGWGWGGGYPGWGWGGGYYGTTIINNPTWTERTWGIYQGPERLSVPTFLETAGDLSKATELRSVIERKRKTAKAWYTVAGVCAAGILTGVVGMGAAQEVDTYFIFNNVALGGLGVAVTGMLGGSFPSARASRLARYPSESLSAQEAQSYVDGHNERLQSELGLSDEEVWAFEVGADEQQRR